MVKRNARRVPGRPSSGQPELEIDLGPGHNVGDTVCVKLSDGDTRYYEVVETSYTHGKSKLRRIDETEDDVPTVRAYEELNSACEHGFSNRSWCNTCRPLRNMTQPANMDSDSVSFLAKNMQHSVTSYGALRHVGTGTDVIREAPHIGLLPANLLPRYRTLHWSGLRLKHRFTMQQLMNLPNYYSGVDGLKRRDWWKTIIRIGVLEPMSTFINDGWSGMGGMITEQYDVTNVTNVGWTSSAGKADVEVFSEYTIWVDSHVVRNTSEVRNDITRIIDLEREGIINA